MDLSSLRTVVTRRDLERMGVPRSQIVAAVRAGSPTALAPGYYMRPGSVGPFAEDRHLALARAVLAPMVPGTALAEVAAAVTTDCPSSVRTCRGYGWPAPVAPPRVRSGPRSVWCDEISPMSRLRFVNGVLTTTVPRTVGPGPI